MHRIIPISIYSKLSKNERSPSQKGNLRFETINVKTSNYTYLKVSKNNTLPSVLSYILKALKSRHLIIYKYFIVILVIYNYLIIPGDCSLLLLTDQASI